MMDEMEPGEYHILSVTRWKMFFDSIGIPSTRYTDLRMSGFDLMLTGENGLMVRVVPAQNFDDLESYILMASVMYDGTFAGDILLVGAHPFMVSRDNEPCIGSLCQDFGFDEDPTEDEGLSRFPTEQGFKAADLIKCLYCRQLGIRSIDQSWRCSPCGHYDGDHFVGHIDNYYKNFYPIWEDICTNRGSK